MKQLGGNSHQHCAKEGSSFSKDVKHAEVFACFFFWNNLRIIRPGEWNDIHPLNKKELARRVALQVKKKVYGHRDVVHSGPLCTDASVESGKIILSFEEGTNDLMPVTELKGFALAGADGRFKWAKATIEGNKVMVWSEGITQPIKVRYAWDDNPQEANLRNKSGLPASPFQMDVP